ncbi:TAP-like protein [compost metagenome]
MRTWAALPNARMIVVENDYRHGVFPYGAACVDKQVANYFLYGQLPERTSSCPGRMQGAYEYDEGDA